MKNHEKNEDGEFFARSNSEADLDKQLQQFFKSKFPIDTPQWNHHLQAYLKRHNIMRILYFNEIYKKILEVPGDILDFGVHYGASSATLLNLRGIYEPYNVSRNIFSFDTFEGFTGVSELDVGSQEGSYKVTSNFHEDFKELMKIHESFSPIAHLTRHNVIKGDARETVHLWKENNPGSLVAMLHLDMDLFAPTLDVINALKDRMFKGTVIVLDELTAKFFPGEMQALAKAFDLNEISLRRSKMQPYSAYFIL